MVVSREMICNGVCRRQRTADDSSAHFVHALFCFAFGRDDTSGQAFDDVFTDTGHDLRGRVDAKDMLESADDGISRAQSHFQAKFGSGFHAGGKAAHEVSADALHAVPESRSLLLDPAPCVSYGFFHLVPVLHHSSTHGDRSCDDSSSQQTVRAETCRDFGNAHACLG